jgi:multiple sugar transport system permease protein
MDSYRVFDEIIGFSSQGAPHLAAMAHLFVSCPRSDGNRAISRASASAMLTIIGVAILLTPLLMRSWRDHRRGF